MLRLALQSWKGPLVQSRGPVSTRRLRTTVLPRVDAWPAWSPRSGGAVVDWMQVDRCA